MSFTDLSLLLQSEDTIDKKPQLYEWICQNCKYGWIQKPDVCVKYLYKLSDKKIMQYMMDEYWIDGFKDFLECKQILRNNNKIDIQVKTKVIIKDYFNDDIKEHCKKNKYDIYLLCDKYKCGCKTFEKTYATDCLTKQHATWLDVTP